MCARQAYGASPPVKHAAALERAEAWVVQPTDEQRRAAFQSAEAAEFNTPAGMIGMAIFFSTGSLAPAGLAEVAPEPHLSQGAVANAVIVSAVMGEAAQASDRYLQSFALGFDVANGKNRWKDK